MSCDNYCTLRKEVLETGEGVWFRMTLATGEEEIVRLHRVNVVSGKEGPAIQVVFKGNEQNVREIPLAQVKKMAAVTSTGQ